MKTSNTAIDMYLELMYEFKERLKIVTIMCEYMYMINKSGNIVNIENICLQLRKLLELIAMSSLVMNQQAFKEAKKGFEKMWNAKYILRDIKNIHADYFPQSISGIISIDSNKMEDIDYNVLDEDLFCKIYDKCGKMLHISNPFSRNDKIVEEYGKNIPEWLDLIYLTMKYHLVSLYGTNLAYAIELNGFDENISYTLLQEKRR